MNVQRGDVVLVDFVFSAGVGAKVRPALVVQNNRDNARLATTVVVQITSVTKRARESTQVAIELATPDGIASGLRQDSVVNCVNILAIDKLKVLRKIGALSPALMQLVNGAIKAALDIT